MKWGFILSVFSLCFANSVYSKDKTVFIEWTFQGVLEGFNHLNRIQIFVDGIALPPSQEVFQSDLGNYVLRVSKGIHQIKLINEAYCKGKWQEHTFNNEFSIDARCEFELNPLNLSKIQVVFDLDQKQPVITRFDKKGLKIVPNPIRFSQRCFPLTIDWKFLNIEPNYDHLSRFCIYVDDVKIFTSNESLESAGGIFEVMLPKGEHSIRIVSECRIDSEWKEHTIVNNFSADVVLDEKRTVSKALSLTWVIDLDNTVGTSNWK
jgi:hypothetical protein